MGLNKTFLSFAHRLDRSANYKKSKAFVNEVLNDTNSLKKRYFDFGMIFLVFTTIMILILEIRHTLPPIVYYYETFAVIVFILEWLGRLWVSSDGYKMVIQSAYDYQDKNLSLWALVKPALISKMKYAFSPMSLIDLMAILPSYRPLRVLRFFLLFRLFKVFRYTSSLNFLLRVFIEKRFEFMILSLIFFFMVFFASTAIYIFEGAGENNKVDSFFDAIYWAVITITTVGYGDISPVTNEGRFITMLLIVSGLGIISFMTSVMTTAMTQKLQEVKSYQVMTEISKLREYILVCGYGKMGKVLSHELTVENKNFLIIDSDEERVEEAKEEGFFAIKTDASDVDILKELQCEKKVRYAVALSGDDATNLSIVLSLKSLNPEIIVFARADDLSTQKKLEMAGAKEAVFSFATAARVGREYLDNANKSQRMVIYGYAKTAIEIVKSLYLDKEDFLFVVDDEESAIRAKEAGFEAKVLNLGVDENLIMIGISQGVEVLFCVNDTYNQNLFVTFSARNLDKELKIISLCATKDESAKMLLAGANHTISPYEIGARRIYRQMKKEDKIIEEGLS